MLSNPELDRAEAQVLSILARDPGPCSPTALISELRTRSVSEAVARAAIWYLIARYEVELTWDRRLRRVVVDGVGAR